jgi:hypothetical protein
MEIKIGWLIFFLCSQPMNKHGKTIFYFALPFKCLVFILMVGMVVFSCGWKWDKNRYKTVQDTLQLPFDTARVIRLMNIAYQKQIPALSQTQVGWDTLELMYIPYACDCQDWVDIAAYENYESSVNDTLLSTFNSQEFSYYLEPINSSVELDPTLFTSHNQVRFIGKFRTQKGWPNNANFQDPDPPMGKVFTYYAYEVILPARVYGPHCFTGKNQYIQPTEIILTTSNKPH